jgi:hypothetical protein
MEMKIRGKKKIANLDKENNKLNKLSIIKHKKLKKESELKVDINNFQRDFHILFFIHFEELIFVVMIKMTSTLT